MAIAFFSGVDLVDFVPSSCLQGVLNLFHQLLSLHLTAAFSQFFNWTLKAEHDHLVMSTRIGKKHWSALLVYKLAVKARIRALGEEDCL